jgi:two-component system chemotaxis response regulator CheY
MIIDDSALSRNMLKRVLGEGNGYIEAAEGMRGLELYFLEHPDLVFLDLTMPGMNGLDVLTQIKRLDPQARVIVATADIQTLTHQEVLSLGASGVITKPFTPEAVEQVVRSVLPES